MSEEYRTITFHGIDVNCYKDGSVEWPDGRSGKPYRTFGSDLGKGYMRVSIRGHFIKVHRLIARAYLPDFSESLEVDHKNGVKKDNRPLNLRMFTSLQNSQGYRAKSNGCSSMFRGVAMYKPLGKWRAKIRFNGRSRHLGYFDCEKDAGRCYDRAAVAAGFQLEALNFPAEHSTK